MKFSFFGRRILLLLITFLMPLPQLHAQWFLTIAEEQLMGNMAGSSGSLLPLPIRQTDELQQILEKSQPQSFNLYSDKSEERVDSDFDDLSPKRASHYIDLKFQALIEESQAETEETGTLNESALGESDQADSDLMTVFNTLLVTASQERHSNLPEPDSQAATETYLSSDTINHCPLPNEDEQGNKKNEDDDDDDDESEPVDTADSGNKPDVPNPKITEQEQYSLEEIEEKLKNLKPFENFHYNSGLFDSPSILLLHKFFQNHKNHQDDVEIKQITGMRDALSGIGDDASDQRLLLTSSILTFFENEQTQKQESLHGHGISIIPDSAVEVTTEAENARDQIPIPEFVELARYMLGFNEDNPGQKPTDIKLPEQNDVTKLPAGHYTFKHHPLGFIKHENKDKSTSYVIYPAGQHYFLTTESAAAVMAFIKTAVEFWGQAYHDVIQYRWVADPNIHSIFANKDAEEALIDAELVTKNPENHYAKECVWVHMSGEPASDEIHRAISEIEKVDGILKLDTFWDFTSWQVFNVVKGNELEVIRNIFTANISGVNSASIDTSIVELATK